MSVWTQIVAFARPSLPEPVELKQYRRIEVLCSWLPLVLAAMVSSMLLNPDLDRQGFAGFLWSNLPAHPLIIAINLRALKFARTPRQHRVVLMMTIALLHWTNVSGMRLEKAALLNGLFMCVTLVFARMVTDAKIGLFALLSAIVQVAAMQGAIFVGLTRPTRYLLTDPLPSWSPSQPIYFLAWSCLLLGLTWMVSSYVANKFRRLAHEIAQEKLLARRTVAEALVQAGHGRLKGAVLAGRYHLRELLGRGGMGEVYEADRVDDGRVVAVKVLFPHMAEMNTVIERFRREALAAQKVSSRFAPELIEMGQDGDGTHFIVMERLRGEDLATLLRRAGHLSPAALLPIVDGIARALEAAHAAGIVHRDLKPQNVFVTAAQEVRLLDFGIARLRDGTTTETLTAEAQVLGTPGFMAPEQARGAAAEIGPHTDVFALAAICYRALSGKNAFPARTAADAIYEALNHQPPALSSVRAEIPVALDAVVSIGLSKRVTDRYASARAFAADYALALQGALPAQVMSRAADLPDTPDPFHATEAFGEKAR